MVGGPPGYYSPGTLDADDFQGPQGRGWFGYHQGSLVWFEDGRATDTWVLLRPPLWE